MRSNAPLRGCWGKTICARRRMRRCGGKHLRQTNLGSLRGDERHFNHVEESGASPSERRRKKRRGSNNRAEPGREFGQTEKRVKSVWEKLTHHMGGGEKFHRTICRGGAD